MNLAKLNPERYLTWDRSVQNYLSNIDVHNDGSTKHSVTSKIARKESYREHVWTRIKGSLPDIVKRRVAHISRGNVKQLLHEIRVICNGRRQKYVKENIQCRDFLKQSCLRGEECRFLHSTKSPPTRFSNFQKGRIPVGKIPKNAKFENTKIDRVNFTSSRQQEEDGSKARFWVIHPEVSSHITYDASKCSNVKRQVSTVNICGKNYKSYAYGLRQINYLLRGQRKTVTLIVHIMPSMRMNFLSLERFREEGLNVTTTSDQVCVYHGSQLVLESGVFGPLKCGGILSCTEEENMKYVDLSFSTSTSTAANTTDSTTSSTNADNPPTDSVCSAVAPTPANTTDSTIISIDANSAAPVPVPTLSHPTSTTDVSTNTNADYLCRTKEEEVNTCMQTLTSTVNALVSITTTLAAISTATRNANNVDKYRYEKGEEIVTASTVEEKGRSSVYNMSSSASTNVTTTAALANALTTIANATTAYKAPVTTVERERRSIHSIGDSRSDTTITIATTALVAGASAVADAVASLSATANTATTATTTEGDGRSSMHSISKSPTTNVTTTAAISSIAVAAMAIATATSAVIIATTAATCISKWSTTTSNDYVDTVTAADTDIYMSTTTSTEVTATRANSNNSNIINEAPSIATTNNAATISAAENTTAVVTTENTTVADTTKNTTAAVTTENTTVTATICTTENTTATVTTENTTAVTAKSSTASVAEKSTYTNSVVNLAAVTTVENITDPIMRITPDAHTVTTEDIASSVDIVSTPDVDNNAASSIALDGTTTNGIVTHKELDTVASANNYSVTKISPIVTNATLFGVPGTCVTHNTHDGKLCHISADPKVPVYSYNALVTRCMHYSRYPQLQSSTTKSMNTAQLSRTNIDSLAQCRDRAEAMPSISKGSPTCYHQGSPSTTSTRRKQTHINSRGRVGT